LSSEKDFEIKKVTDGIYLENDDGKKVYSLTFSSSAKMTVSEVFTPDKAKSFEEFISSKKKINLDSINRLAVQATSQEYDDLRAFLFAWTAMEIFINKIFKEIEAKFLDEYTKDTSPKIVNDFFERIKDVMKDKYRLKEKFIVISSVLGSAEEEDLRKFLLAKNVRDNFLHGEDLDMATFLPCKSLILALLKKYLKFYLLLKVA
jgi:hypothetical protein